MKFLNTIMAACALLLGLSAAQAQTPSAPALNAGPNWISWNSSKNPNDIVRAPQVSAWFPTKIDSKNGKAVNLQIAGNPSIPTCPVASCPTTTAAGGLFRGDAGRQQRSGLGDQLEHLPQFPSGERVGDAVRAAWIRDHE
ncbi:hypothetical protein AD940_14060 [Gluconobacter thailandicus]|uniref:hypothetical protein n=1 Tax=Gluconobacter thailandicus TaxID=257438 RepID=UPI000776DBD7|nr:hypothetical protein [Gluconobacter thailandicus]KXV33068.1 hypothetical protein AD940_14060 [Gluconobacter thailandicus]